MFPECTEQQISTVKLTRSSAIAE